MPSRVEEGRGGGRLTGTRRKLIFGRVLPEKSLAFLENLVLAAVEKHHLAGVH